MNINRPFHDIVLNFNHYNTWLQYLISALAITAIGAAISAVIYAILSPHIGSFLATASLICAILAIFVEGNERGGMALHYKLMTISLFMLAMFSVMESLGIAGVVNFESVDAARLYRAILLFIGISITATFTKRYMDVRDMKRAMLEIDKMRSKITTSMNGAEKKYLIGE